MAEMASYCSSCSSKKLTKLQMKGMVTLSLFFFSNAVATTSTTTTTTTTDPARPQGSVELDSSARIEKEEGEERGSVSLPACHHPDTPTNESDAQRCMMKKKNEISTHPTDAPSSRHLPSAFFTRHEQKMAQEKGEQYQNHEREALLAQDGNLIVGETGGDHEDWCPKCLQACGFVPRGGHTFAASTTEKVAEQVLEAASTAAAATSTTATTPYGIPLNAWKVVMQAFLTAINVLCWLGPLQSKKISDNQLALSLANAFSGGVFLSLAFFHLIPECTHGFDSSWPETTPYGLILGGYLLIFFVEKVAFDAHDIMHEMQQGGSQHPPIESKTAASDSVGAPGLKNDASSSGRSAMILLGALAVHSVLEMMALGLASSFGDAALLTMSIALHQPAESIALLVAFLKSGMPKQQIIQSLSIFSCMGPVGVALGMAVNAYAAPVVDSIMLAVVAGTFVYVGATEVIPEEWEDSSHKWKKFAALMSGIVMIVAVTQYTANLGE